MRLSAVRIVTLGLGCFTVVTLLVAAALIPVPSGANNPSLAAVRAAVERFVAATNATIATGESGDFDGVLADDFVLHAEEIGLGSDQTALAHYLAGVHASFPDLVFVPGEIAADGNIAMLRLGMRGDAAGGLAGLPVQPAPDPGNSFIVLRLDGGRVAELWNFVTLPAVETMATVTVPSLSSAPVVGAFRATYAPGATEPDRILPGPVIVSLERGVLRAKVKGSAHILRAGATEPEIVIPTSPNAEIDLWPGEMLIIPALTWYGLRNPGNGQAETLVVGVLSTTVAVTSDPQRGIAPVTTTWPGESIPGVTFDHLAGGDAPELPAGQLQVAFVLVSMAPGMGVALVPGRWAALVVCESGSLQLPDGSDARLLFPGEGALITGGPDESAALPRTLATGTVALDDDSEAVTLLVISFMPTGD